MRILIVSNGPDLLADFLATLMEADDVRLGFAPTAVAALEGVKTNPPTVCVVDGNLPDVGETGAFGLVARLMQVNALVSTAVLSDLSQEDFHEAGEGLGILCQLPAHPDGTSAKALLAALAKIFTPAQ